ncbi:MAG: integrase family protein [Allopontixanthobacter sediminis]
MKNVSNFRPSSIDALRSGKKSDPLTPGLSIEVSDSGRKVWRYRRRVANSTTTVGLQLGPFPAHSIAAARAWAQDLNLSVERGVDPREAWHAEAARIAMTVEKAHQLYMAAMRRGDRRRLKPRTISDKEVMFNRDIKPRLGSVILDELTEDACWDAVYDKARASKDRANKMAGELNCFLKWCSGREGQMAGISLAVHPAPTLNSNWFDTGPKANQRFLDEDELKCLFQALVDEPHTYRRGFTLLLLTAARRNELFAAPASEVSEGIWILPAERSKNGEANFVALGPWGKALAQTNHRWLFPSPRTDGPQLHGWFKARDRIHARMEQLAGRRIPSWHFHDFRRTFRSNARELGIDRDIAELMLNHKRKGIEGVYDKNLQLELRAAGFEAWESFLCGLIAKTDHRNRLGIPEASAKVETKVE